MLDDLKLIHQRDAQDALGIAEKGWEQYLYNFNFSWTPKETISEVMLAGMGGSGLAAKAYKNFAELSVPFEIIQDYKLPERTNKQSLLICSSYSGNTEEIISVISQALEPTRADSRPMIIVIASGGKLLEIAKQHSLPFVVLPSGFQPRHTFGYQYRALAEIMDTASLKKDEINEIEESAKWLKDKSNNLLPDVPTKDNPAKELAQELVGNSIVVYSSNLFSPAAYKWKISFNENAKTVAWYNSFPEFNHNEFIGWASHPTDKPYKIVDLRSSFDNERIQMRFDVSERLLSGKRPHPQTVNAEGDGLLKQLMWLILYGDFVSLYVAILNGLNPTPVELIEKLKDQLK